MVAAILKIMNPYVLLLCITLCSCQLSCETLAPRGTTATSTVADGAPWAAADRDEVAPEDQEALDDLIFTLEEAGAPAEESSFDPSLAFKYKRHERVPTAAKNGRMSAKSCRRRLKELGVATEVPSFETPLVDTPLLLTAPIAGVAIVARWPKKKPVNEVMDCHLVLALVDVAHRAAALGFSKLEYYSAYRPLSQPPKKCSKGKRGQRCRKKQAKYKKLIKGKLSQHRRALGIDIRWLTKNDGSVLDVLEDYDRRDGQPPCGYEAGTSDQRMLQEFACGLHRDQMFNVVLTPNANKDHHNHFHFDITPKVDWHIAK